MWTLFKRKPGNEPSDEKKLKNFNFWYVLLLSFIILWVAGAYVYLIQKTDEAHLTSPPIVLVEGLQGMSPGEFTNFFSVNQSDVKVDLPDSTTKPLFESKVKYEIGDVVVVRYFYVEAVVIDRSYPQGESYTILYKDHNHTLRTIKLPKALLLAPVDGALNPVSLLVD